jgi:hypothetical protein
VGYLTLKHNTAANMQQDLILCPTRRPSMQFSQPVVCAPLALSTNSSFAAAATAMLPQLNRSAAVQGSDACRM